MKIQNLENINQNKDNHYIGNISMLIHILLLVDMIIKNNIKDLDKKEMMIIQL